MRLEQYFQQSWFVLLMAFVMSCATVSVASAKSMHINMSHQQLDSDCVQPTKQHGDVHQKHLIQHTSNNHNHCDDTQTTKADCLDCSFSACHSLMTWLDVNEADQQDVIFIPSHTQVTSPYTAQHLHGFWQEILRPPKA